MRELVGQGKPFYSSLDKAAGLLRRKVGTGSEFLKELMSIPGVKQAEVAERGLGELLNAPKMTHEQFMAALSAKPAPAIGEKVLGGDRSEPDSDAPHHERWTLPGGENYREMLIKAPEPEGLKEKIMEMEAMLRRTDPNDTLKIQHYKSLIKKYQKLNAQNEQFSGVSQHFGGEPGILASLRLKDRTGPTGEKLLHLEELQSDWHQQGRDRGYKNPTEEQATEAETKRIAKQRRELVKQLTEYEDIHGHISPEMQQQWNKFREIEDAHRQTEKDVRDRLPDAPFKKNWEEMALKRLIHHAAEKGYHGIVVTPGAEQADRYGLAKHVGMVSYHPGEKRFQAFKHNRETVVNERGASPERVAELIGKEAAQRLLAAPKVGDHHFLEGEDLNIGGEGMKGFYDKKVPNILNSIGKKYGVKTGAMKVPMPPKDSTKVLGYPGGEDYVQGRTNWNEFLAQSPQAAKEIGTHLHYLPITEEMRQDVKKNGIPLYESGGSVSTQ